MKSTANILETDFVELAAHKQLSKDYFSSQWDQFFPLKRNSFLFMRACFEYSPENSRKMLQERNLLHENPWSLLNGKKQLHSTKFE